MILWHDNSSGPDTPYNSSLACLSHGTFHAFSSLRQSSPFIQFHISPGRRRHFPLACNAHTYLYDRPRLEWLCRRSVYNKIYIKPRAVAAAVLVAETQRGFNIIIRTIVLHGPGPYPTADTPTPTAATHWLQHTLLRTPTSRSPLGPRRRRR